MRQVDSVIQRSNATTEEKSIFMANISHGTYLHSPGKQLLILEEMRTPLFSIIGWTELLLDMNLNEKQAEIVKTISFCSHNMLGRLGLDVVGGEKLWTTLLTFNLWTVLLM